MVFLSCSAGKLGLCGSGGWGVIRPGEAGSSDALWVACSYTAPGWTDRSPWVTSLHDACLLFSPFRLPRMLMRARVASLPTVGSKGPPPTRTSCPGDPMPPTPATHPPPAAPLWAATAAAAPPGTQPARGCTRISDGSWRWAPPTVRAWRRPARRTATSRAAVPWAPRASPISCSRPLRARCVRPEPWQSRTSWCTRRTRRWSRPHGGSGSTTGCPWKVREGASFLQCWVHPVLRGAPVQMMFFNYMELLFHANFKTYFVVVRILNVRSPFLAYFWVYVTVLLTKARSRTAHLEHNHLI